MPYITKERREKIESEINTLCIEMVALGLTDDGDLNYVISKILNTTLEISDLPKYTKINKAIGVLECVKLELYRRIAAPYEDKKIEENGDVY